MTSAFEAVADETRRSILDRLHAAGPLSLSALTEPLPMTRQAVTKHLDTLAEAGLIRIHRRGRERIHELDPEPLRRVDRWLAPYAAAWDDRLARLERYLEEEETP